jgi:hypothetical protein
MTFEPYPTGPQPYPTGPAGNAAPQRPPQPRSVLYAVRLMYAGAALGLIAVIVTVAFSGRVKRAVRRAEVRANRTRAREHKALLTAAQIHSLESAVIIVLVVALIIGVLLWLWMAWANGKGSRWARWVATVLFALNTLTLISGARAASTAIFAGLSWIIGLAAIILLWRKESSAYINTPSP